MTHNFNNMKKTKPFIIVACLLCSMIANAQMARMHTSESGLANSHTHDIYQDSKGFIWFSTENGLSRFDGIKFHTFNFDRNNPNSIASNVVRKVFEDSTGKLWVGTSAGLQVFDTEYNSFKKINLEDWSVPDSDQHIMDIEEISYGNSRKIVAGSSGHGIYIIDAETYAIEREMQNAMNRIHDSEYISGMFMDSKERLWISSDTGGLTVMDMKSGKNLTDIWGPGTIHMADDTFDSFIEDNRTGNIIIGTAENGIVIFDDSTGKIRKAKGRQIYDYRIITMIPNNIAPQESRQTFLVGIENHGIKLFDAEAEEIRDIHFPNVSYDTSKWKVHSLMEDRQGNIWAGAIQRGVLVIPKSMFGFENVSLDSEISYGDNSKCVTSVIEDSENGCMWIGTDGSGLYRIGRDGTRMNLSSENSALSNNSIMSVALDKRGKLWVATYLGGLYTYTKESGFRQFKDQKTLNTEKIYCIKYSPDDDIIYAGTHGNGFSMINAKEERVLKTWQDDSYKWVSSLYIDRAGLLWIGTYNGPLAYDNKVDKIIEYNLNEEKSIRVNAIYESKDGNIWIGTGEGLVCLKRSDKETKLYTVEDGLPSNSINDILEDDNGNLWISTLNGLSRFEMESGVFSNFYQHDGLQENEFNSKSAFKSADGRLYFGGIKGLTAFYPDKISVRSLEVPSLYLSNLTVMNSDVMYDPLKGDNILDKHISEATQITLPNDAKMFSLEFTVLEYTNPQKISYEYMMEGLDKCWHSTLPGSQTATYTNIPHGRYRLKIRAFYDGNPEKQAYKEIGIRILPPWYLSIWAWMAYCLIGVLSILAFFQQRKRKLDLKIQQEESEIKEMKLQMFTNISHEIRTPLTLVMNPLKKMRENETDRQQKDLYNLMYRNCLRILRLVNQLLDMRKVDNGQMKLHFLETDIIYFIKDIMQSFENLAVSRHIDFSMESKTEPVSLWIDQGNFDKIIFNILSNAFKHTPDKGEIKIKVSSPIINNNGILNSSIQKYIEFIIENSGSAIEERHLEKLFDRFYQADVRDARVGSGVGLHLTKMLVKLHHGEISAYNTTNGVAFRIRIPLGCSHLNAEEMTTPVKHKDLYTKNSSSTYDHSSTEDITYNASDIIDEDTGKHTKSKKSIILVDDDSEMRAYLKLELQSIYNIEVYANGKEAWGKITTSIPDAVITDLVMEKMDGAELCEKIKKNPGTNHIPVILLTSSTDEQSQQRCIESGADRFFTKPISLEILKSAIAGAISTRETIKNKYSREIDYGYGEITMSNADNELSTKVISIIRQNIDNSDFSVEELSKEVGMSRVHLNRKLKETMNISPSNLIRSIRLKQAAYLLINNKVNISEVAYKVGFSTHSYFSNSFHDFFGMTPKEFTAQYMNCTDEETLKKLFG